MLNSLQTFSPITCVNKIEDLIRIYFLRYFNRLKQFVNKVENWREIQNLLEFQDLSHYRLGLQEYVHR